MFVGGFFSFRRVLLITSNRVFFDALGGFYFSSFSGAFFCHAARHNRGENNLAGDKECVTIARTFSSDCDGCNGSGIQDLEVVAKTDSVTTTENIQQPDSIQTEEKKTDSVDVDSLISK